MRITTLDSCVETSSEETVLESLEKSGHAVEYQCTGGYCGSCRLSLLAGEVEYIEQPLSCIAADEILPCCCCAKTDLVLQVKLANKRKAG